MARHRLSATLLALLTLAPFAVLEAQAPEAAAASGTYSYPGCYAIGGSSGASGFATFVEHNRASSCATAKHYARSYCTTPSYGIASVRTDFAIGDYTATFSRYETFTLRTRVTGLATSTDFGQYASVATGYIEISLVDSRNGNVAGWEDYRLDPPGFDGGGGSMKQRQWVNEEVVVEGAFYVESGVTYYVNAKVYTEAGVICNAAGPFWAVAEFVGSPETRTDPSQFFTVEITSATATWTSAADCQASGDAGDGFWSPTPVSTPLGDCNGWLESGDEDWYSYYSPGGTTYYRFGDTSESTNVCFTFYQPNGVIYRPTGSSGDCAGEGRDANGWTRNFPSNYAGTWRIRAWAPSGASGSPHYTIAVDPY